MVLDVYTEADRKPMFPNSSHPVNAEDMWNQIYSEAKTLNSVLTGAEQIAFTKIMQDISIGQGLTMEQGFADGFSAGVDFYKKYVMKQIENLGSSHPDDPASTQVSMEGCDDW